MSQFSPQRLTVQSWNLDRNNAIILLDAYKQGRIRVMLPDIWGFSEPLLAGFGCDTTTQKAVVRDQGQADRERSPQPKIDTSGSSTWTNRHNDWIKIESSSQKNLKINLICFLKSMQKNFSFFGNLHISHNAMLVILLKPPEINSLPQKT